MIYMAKTGKKVEFTADELHVKLSKAFQLEGQLRGMLPEWFFEEPQAASDEQIKIYSAFAAAQRLRFYYEKQLYES